MPNVLHTAYLNALGIPLWVHRDQDIGLAPTSAPIWHKVLGDLPAPCIAVLGPIGCYDALDDEAKSVLHRLHGLFLPGTLAWVEYDGLAALQSMAQGKPVVLGFGVPVGIQLPSLDAMVVEPKAKRTTWDLLKKQCSAWLKPTA
ncbi:MAG: hypothetical protein V4490_07035 [Pseudomonadota bacterium]